MTNVNIPDAPATELIDLSLRGIVDALSEGVITTDQDQVVIMANPAAHEIFGRDNLIGLPLAELLPPRYRAQHREDMEAFGRGRISRREMGRRSDVIGLRVTGEEFPLDATISVARVDGHRLHTVILRDITEIKRDQQELEASHAELERLVSEQDRVAEEERKRIARELHDELAQMLAVIRLNVGAAARVLTAEPDRVRTLLADTNTLTGEAIASTRRLINALRPPALEQLGLTEAIRGLIIEFSRRASIAAELDAPDAVDKLDADVALGLYRIVQEGLNNVSKHAHGEHVTVSLGHDEQGRIRLTISDDGIGIRSGDHRKAGSFGLTGMHERVRSIGGELTISSGPAIGTRITVTVPSS